MNWNLLQLRFRFPFSAFGRWLTAIYNITGGGSDTMVETCCVNDMESFEVFLLGSNFVIQEKFALLQQKWWAMRIQSHSRIPGLEGLAERDPVPGVGPHSIYICELFCSKRVSWLRIHINKFCMTSWSICQLSCYLLSTGCLLAPHFNSLVEGLFRGFWMVFLLLYLRCKLAAPIWLN